MTCGLFGIGYSFSDLTPRVSWNAFDQVCLFGLDVSDFYRIMHAAIFYRNTQYEYCNAI